MCYNYDLHTVVFVVLCTDTLCVDFYGDNQVNNQKITKCITVWQPIIRNLSRDFCTIIMVAKMCACSFSALYRVAVEH